MKYRKKPVVIEAIHFSGDNRNEVLAFSGTEATNASTIYWRCGVGDSPGEIVIRTLEGDLVASEGDWIIRGVIGEIYPCKPQVFDATYDLAE